jgi:hypothetical protein
VLVTLVVRNSGHGDAPNVRVDNALPWPLRLITGTLSHGDAAQSQGDAKHSAYGVGTATEFPRENRILWEGEVAIGAPVTLTYRAVAPPVLQEGMWLFNAAHLEDGLGGAWERGGWLYVEPHRLYLPIIPHGG